MLQAMVVTFQWLTTRVVVNDQRVALIDSRLVLRSTDEFCRLRRSTVTYTIEPPSGTGLPACLVK